MNALKGACIIGQSGGPTAVINASALGAIQAALQCEHVTHVLGAANGIEGVLNERLYDMVQEDPEELELLKYTPASALGSCRYRMADPSVDDADYRRLLEVFRRYGVRYFFYNGGNDSMDTCNKISKFMQQSGYECRVIGIPKTIDNDLYGTDHCPGFGSAAKFIATSCMEVHQDLRVYDKGRVTIVEIMGRHAGWLTAAAALPRTVGARAPHLIYLPEVAFDPEQFIQDVKEVQCLTRNCIVAVSEGVRLANGSFAAENFQSGVVDAFGHRYLSGVGKYLEALVREKIGCKVRSIELNVLQRCSSHLMSATDVREARKIGSYAIRFALQGHTGVMMVLERVSNRPYMVRIGCKPVSEIANREQLVPRTWINKRGNDVTDEMFEYLLPLIEGEVPYPTQNGMPVHFVLDKTIVK